MRFAGSTMFFGHGDAAWAEVDARLRRLVADEAELRRRFWKKLKGLAARLPFAEDLIAAHYCAFDRQTPLHVKAVLVGALAYFVVPVDFIPDVLPIIGYSDDAAVLAAAIKLVSSHVKPDHREAARQTLARMRGEEVA
ncbi:MAG TPA: YkvA family protein [Xanthobacteraceae bacterium]|nr:YkvA family protein [Xanthobacteraceae bacterium]